MFSKSQKWASFRAFSYTWLLVCCNKKIPSKRIVIYSQPSFRGKKGGLGDLHGFLQFGHCQPLDLKDYGHFHDILA